VDAWSGYILGWHARLPLGRPEGYPIAHLMSAEVFGEVLLGRLDDPVTGSWARAQLSRTTLATAVSAIRAVYGFSSASWIS
jgi:hypothetical protein